MKGINVEAGVARIFSDFENGPTANLVGELLLQDFFRNLFGLFRQLSFLGIVACH